MDYWIAGLMDIFALEYCCKSKSYAKITIWEKSEMPILEFFLKSNIYATVKLGKMRLTARKYVGF